MAKSRRRRFFAICSVAISVLLLGIPSRSVAQGWDDVGFWSADLALNTLQQQAAAQKLEEYRKTYVILRDGYRIVRGLVSDNHKLHEEFFNELASINPVVKNYHRVLQTVEIYGREIKNIKQDAPRLVALLRRTDAFTAEELEQIMRVFDGMLDKIKGSFEELALVALESSDGLEMMDSERLVIVERLYKESIKITQSISEFRTLLLTIASQRTNTSVSNLANVFRVVP